MAAVGESLCLPANQRTPSSLFHGVFLLSLVVHHPPLARPKFLSLLQFPRTKHELRRVITRIPPRSITLSLALFPTEPPTFPTHPSNDRFARISRYRITCSILAIGARDFHRPRCVPVASRLQAAGSRWEAIYALNGSAFFHGSRDTSSCA